MLEHETEKFTAFYTTLKFLFVDCRFTEVSRPSTTGNIIFAINGSCATGSISTEYWNMRQNNSGYWHKTSHFKSYIRLEVYSFHTSGPALVVSL